MSLLRPALLASLPTRRPWPPLSRGGVEAPLTEHPPTTAPAPASTTAPPATPTEALDAVDPVGEAVDPVGESGRAAGPQRSERRPRRASAGVWFSAGFGLALGAALAVLLVEALLNVSGVVVLVLLSLLIAVSLEPLVTWLVRRHIRRGWAVGVVVLGFAAAIAGFLAVVIPPAASEITAFINAIPGWLQQLHDHQSTLGRFEDQYHIIEKVQTQITAGGTSSALAQGRSGAGQAVVSAVTASIVVITMTVYFLAGMPAIKRFCFRCVPGSRRAGVEAITDQALTQVGRFMLGNIVTSAIAGVGAFVWCLAMDIPFAAALAIMVALLDLVPMIGSTVAGVVVCLVALTVSWPTALASAVFFIVYRLFEDYLLVPRVMRRAVSVHPIVTVLAVLVGGSLLGVIGGLVAIPIAVTIGLVLNEVVFPRVDRA